MKYRSQGGQNQERIRTESTTPTTTEIQPLINRILTRFKRKNKSNNR